MTIRDIFVPLAADIDSAPQLDAAAQLVQALDARVDVVFIRQEAVIAAAGMSEMLAVAGVIVEAIEHEANLAETSAMTQFEQWRAGNPLPPASAQWHDRLGRVADTIAEIGRVSDLIIIGKPTPDEPATEEMFRAAIYSTGCPTMIIPDRPSGSLLDHMLIAWNGSVEAARAVAGAMPLLKAAKRVSVFTVAENHKALHNHLGLVEHLEHHGVRAAWAEPSGGSGDLGLRLARTASQERATMIVMGAYTHHRVQQVLLGGVTQHMLRHSEIPILMMH